MPNWKKVITSGSDAALRTLEVSNQFTANGTGSLNLSGSFTFTGSVTISGNIITNSVTGSLQGTGSWANNAITSSYVTGSIFNSTNPVTSASFAVTASHALNVSPPVTINNNTDNFVVTATGTSATVQGEPNLRFDGSVLTLTGSMLVSGSNANIIVTGSVAATAGFTGNLTGTSSWSEATRRVAVSVQGTLAAPGGADDDYFVPMIREQLVGVANTFVYASTSSMVYSASLGLLYVTASWAYSASNAITASWAYTASNAVTASYALNAVQTSPQGSISEIQYNVDGVNFGGVSTLTYDGTDLIGTGSFTGRFDGNLRLGLYRGTRISVPVIASATDEALVYSQYIPAGTFTDDDVMRVRWRVRNSSKSATEYYIYMADTGDFSTISGSSANIIAFCTASANTTGYLQMKRDFSFDTSKGVIQYIRSSRPFITDDIEYIDANSTGSFSMDWAGTDYYMFFSAKPNATDHSCQSIYYTIERV